MQRGSLAIVTRKEGPAVWQFRWSEKDLHGARVQRKRVIGTVELKLHALSPLGPHNGDYQMLTTDRSDALGQLRSDVACCRQRQRAP
jgi:hypothetical protein